MDNERIIVGVDDLSDDEVLGLGKKLGAMGRIDVSRLSTTVVETTKAMFFPNGGAETFAQACNERIARLLGEKTPPLRHP